MAALSMLDQLGLNKATDDISQLEVVLPNEVGPVEARLTERLTNLQDAVDRRGEEQTVARSGNLADRLSANRDAQFERATRGMDLSDRQKAAASRRLGLSRSLNRAMATNATRRGFAARSEAAASAGSGLSDALFSQRLSSTQDLAAAQAGHEAADAQRKAQKKASLIGTIGTIAGAALMMMSSEKVKDDHGHEEGLLSKLKKVRVNRWNYKGENKTHVGPFAEEFNKEFGIDTDRTDMINVIDALGVTLGAVKELDKKVEARG